MAANHNSGAVRRRCRSILTTKLRRCIELESNVHRNFPDPVHRLTNRLGRIVSAATARAPDGTLTIAPPRKTRAAPAFVSRPVAPAPETRSGSIELEADAPTREP